jgi:hypothetical protein
MNDLAKEQLVQALLALAKEEHDILLAEIRKRGCDEERLAQASKEFWIRIERDTRASIN